MSNGAEFSWDYGRGGNSGNYGQMGMNGGNGRQWLHSNQANTAFMQGSGAPGAGQNAYGMPGNPYASYNDSMMGQYTHFKPNFGHTQLEASLGNAMGGPMSHIMDDSMPISQGMGGQRMGGQGKANGLGGGQRLSGGYSRRSNGLNDPNPSRAHQSSWF